MGSMLRGHVEPLRRDGHVVRNRWRLVVEMPDEARSRRVKTVTAVGKRRADGLLTQFKADLEREIASAQDPTVDELFAAWAAVRRTSAEKPWRPKTDKFHSDNHRLHISEALGARKASEVQPSDLAMHYAALAEEGIGETSRHHVNATIKAMYNWGIRNEIVSRNPAMLLEEPPQQVPTKKRIWTEAEIAKALAAASGAYLKRPKPPQLVYIPIVLGAYGGLRCGEICGLRWSCVDFETGGVQVACSISQTAKGVLHEEEPKTEASSAFVPLPASAMEILREHKARQDELRLAHGRRRWNREGWVICRQNGLPVKPSNLSSAWSRFVRTHELPVTRLHDLRHAFVTAIFEEGGEEALAVAQALARHADPTITAKTYLHSTPHKVAAAVAAREARISAALADSAQVGHYSGTDAASLDDKRAEKSCKGL